MNFLNEIPKYIDVNNKGVNDSGEYVRGKYRGLNVSANEHGVSISGSLWKSYHRNNLAPFFLHEVKDTIDILSDGLHLPIDKAKVTRVDIAGNVSVNHKPLIYYPYLGKCRYYERWTREKSLYYERPQIVLSLYDKIAEIKSEAGGIPNSLTGQNVLRYEMRLKNRVCQQLKLNEVNAAMLYDDSFFRMVVNKWSKEYTSIVKIKSDSQNYFQTMETVTRKDLIEGIALIAITASGNPTLIHDTIDNLYTMGKIKNRTEKSRMKSDINSLLSKANFVGINELIAELDKKIELTKEQYTNIL
jgi:hypothetical protein